MVLTAFVKDELSRLDIRKASARKAEVSAILRFAGGLEIISGRVVVQAEVDLASTARRVRTAIAEVYGRESEILSVSGSKDLSGRYFIRVTRDGAALARQAGLLDRRGNPVRGLPPAVIHGPAGDVEALWRGAFLAQGSLTGQVRPTSLAVTCPSPEAALALAGAARRLGIEATAREVRGQDRVMIRNTDAIAAMLTHMGARKSHTEWEQRATDISAKTSPANKMVNFQTSNQRRTAVAAAAVVARIERAFEILGDDVPDHLKYAGELRIIHHQASLEELGRLADPPLSKDSMAGRIRRLLDTANKRWISDQSSKGTGALVAREQD